MCAPYHPLVCFDINSNNKNNNTFDMDNYHVETNISKQQQACIYSSFQLTLKKLV